MPTTLGGFSDPTVLRPLPRISTITWQGVLIWSCEVAAHFSKGVQAFFFGVWAKTRFAQKSKNSIFPQKTRFQKAKTRFFRQFLLQFGPFLRHKIAMTHKISPKKLISDLKTAKKAKTRLTNVKT